VFGGLVLMETKVLKSATPANVGLRLANIANQSFNLLSKYQINDVFEVGGQATYASSIYGGTLAANPNKLPAHWRFDAFVEAKLAPTVTAKLFATNIFDKLYYDAFYQSAVPFTFVAPGRTISLIVSAKF
jgi:catecholate siderophore receptor